MLNLLAMITNKAVLGYRDHWKPGCFKNLRSFVDHQIIKTLKAKMKILPNRTQIVFSPLSVQQFFNEYVYIIWNRDFLSMLVHTQEVKKREKEQNFFFSKSDLLSVNKFRSQSVWSWQCWILPLQKVFNIVCVNIMLKDSCPVLNSGKKISFQPLGFPLIYFILNQSRLKNCWSDLYWALL